MPRKGPAPKRPIDVDPVYGSQLVSQLVSKILKDGKKQVGSGIVAIVGVTEDGKAGLAVGVTEDLTQTWNAVDLVKAGAEALGGKGGGGRPDLAQAVGPDGAKANDALAAIEKALAEKVTA